MELLNIYIILYAIVHTIIILLSSGTIPSAFGDLTTLTLFVIDNCDMTGNGDYVMELLNGCGSYLLSVHINMDI